MRDYDLALERRVGNRTDKREHPLRAGRAPSLCCGHGADVQAAMVIIAPVVLTVVIVARIGEQPDSYTSWAVLRRC